MGRKRRERILPIPKPTVVLPSSDSKEGNPQIRWRRELVFPLTIPAAQALASSLCYEDSQPLEESRFGPYRPHKPNQKHPIWTKEKPYTLFSGLVVFLQIPSNNCPLFPYLHTCCLKTGLQNQKTEKEIPNQWKKIDVVILFSNNSV